MIDARRSSAGGTHERALRRARDARPELREREQFAQLRARSRTPRRTRRLRADACRRRPASITSREALARLPVVRKSELAELQRAARRSADWRAARWGAARRVFASPGGIYEPEGAAPDYWRLARALFAAGFRAGDLVHNCFSYHLHAGGLDARNRRARARLHGVSRRHRARPNSKCGDGRSAAGRLRRHAVVPAHHPRARRRARREVAEPDEGAGFRPKPFPPSLARCADRARRPRLSGLRDRGRRRDRLRDAGARRPRPRRRRAGRDRAAGHRRSGGAGRSGRGRRHAARQRRLPADPLRHRRPVGDAAGRCRRAGARTSGSRAGSAAPTRRRR